MPIMRENERIVIHRLGESFWDCTQIRREPCAEPGPGEVLIRNHFAGVNGVYDQMMCLDKVEHTRVTPPADTGVEAIGIVEAVGDGVVSPNPGQSVVTVKVGQGYRHWQLSSAEDAIPVPHVAPEVLALIPSGVSALVALEQVGELTTGETVLITAAAGGLGNVMTQLAVEADNHVIAVCGTADKAAWLASVGADRVINYRNESPGAVLASEYADSIDLAMDSVGGDVFDVLVDHLAPRGRLVICGYTSDRHPTALVNSERIYTKLYWKAASIRGFMNFRFAEHGPDARTRLLARYQRGELRPLVDRQQFAGLESVADAVDYLLAGRNLGKVVVDLRD